MPLQIRRAQQFGFIVGNTLNISDQIQPCRRHCPRGRVRSKDEQRRSGINAQIACVYCERAEQQYRTPRSIEDIIHHRGEWVARLFRKISGKNAEAALLRECARLLRPCRDLRRHQERDAALSIAAHSLSLRLREADPMFSSTCCTDEVPGIGNITRERCSSQAMHSCAREALCRRAASSSTPPDAASFP